MARTVKPPTPTISDDVTSTGGFTLITATVSGAAQTIFTPTAISPARQFVLVVVGSIHTASVTLSIAINGVHTFDQTIPTKSGLNTVFAWEEFRAGAGAITCWASVANVLSFKPTSRHEE